VDVRKLVLNLVASVLLLFPVHSVFAQQAPKIPRIGFVSATGDANNPGSNVEAFRQGLRDLGYFEGKNILVEYRYAEGNQDRIPGLVAELVQLKVEVFVVGAQASIRAAKQATKTIPIVMVSSLDPVAAGMVDSLARPGGNITGLARLTRDLSGKRLELLKEVVPGIKRVGVLRIKDDSTSSIAFKEYEAAAEALKIQLQSLEVQRPTPHLEAAFHTAAKGPQARSSRLGIRYSHVTQSRLRTLP
jgi:putative tryptophan/tyrosine transport system substrate-binding protein